MVGLQNGGNLHNCSKSFKRDYFDIFIRVFFRLLHEIL